MNTYREKTKTMIKRGKNDTQIDEMKRTKMEVGDDSRATDDCRRDEISQPATHPPRIDMKFQYLKKNTATTSTQHRLHQRYTHIQGYDSKNNNNSNNIEYRKKMHNS